MKISTFKKKKIPIKILVMGLPGSGKTYLAKRIARLLGARWLNADKIRERYNDWDFTEKGILRQATRMKNFAEKSKKKYVVADFICPLSKQRKIFNPNYIIWMNTIKKSRYPRMNRIFKKPKNYDLKFDEKNLPENLIKVKKKVLGKKWKNYKIYR